MKRYVVIEYCERYNGDCDDDPETVEITLETDSWIKAVECLFYDRDRDIQGEIVFDTQTRKVYCSESEKVVKTMKAYRKFQIDILNLAERGGW